MTDTSNIFARLPPEILICIYLQTANPSFSLTSIYIYSVLLSEHVRFIFCANVFDPTFDWGLEHPNLAIAQTFVVAQNWFTPEFAQRVQAECRNRVAVAFEATVPRTTAGAKLPSYCLRAPWTDQKVALLEELTRWNMKSTWTREKKRYPGLNEAIAEGRGNIVEIYAGPAVHCLIEERDILHALDIAASKSILESLISGFGSNGPVAEKSYDLILEALSKRKKSVGLIKQFKRKVVRERRR